MSVKDLKRIITPEDREHFAKVLNKKFISDKVIRTLMLVNNGVEISQAIFLATGNKNPSADTVCRIKRESELSLLASQKLDKLATSTYEHAMMGKPVISEYEDIDADGKPVTKRNIMIPKYQHALAAADAVKARTEPIKSSAPTKEGDMYIQVNLEGYKAQDVVEHTIDNDVVIEQSN